LEHSFLPYFESGGGFPKRFTADTLANRESHESVSGQKPAVLKKRKLRVRYLADNQTNPFGTRKIAIISIILDLVDFRWFCAGFSYTLCTKMQQFELPL
jgi:hypothetical protein